MLKSLLASVPPALTQSISWTICSVVLLYCPGALKYAKLLNERRRWIDGRIHAMKWVTISIRMNTIAGRARVG